MLMKTVSGFAALAFATFLAAAPLAAAEKSRSSITEVSAQAVVTKRVVVTRPGTRVVTKRVVRPAVVPGCRIVTVSKRVGGRTVVTKTRRCG
jgi:hypothetical protein